MAQLVAARNGLQAHPLDGHSDDDLDLLHETLDSNSSRNSHSLAEDHLEDILSYVLLSRSLLAGVLHPPSPARCINTRFSRPSRSLSR
jgi:hypothetical protein